jgi:SSS family solute:Na+ symporter
MAVFWLFIRICQSHFHSILGAAAINGLLPTTISIQLSVLYAIIITLGGMKVIGYTDVIQVAVLIIGGLVTVYMALDKVSGGSGVGNGFTTIMREAPDHFHMILNKPGSGSPQGDIDKYLILPGILMYVAGQWIANLNYWGCNQYITQRALGADLKTARTGILFAAFLKILMPVIVMLPGIAAYVLVKQGHVPHLAKQDDAYASVLGFLPEGLKGLSIAALTAAIVASLAGKANSISTIFTLDIYKKYVNKEATDKRMVWMGRAVVLIAMVIAIAFTWKDLLGISSEGGFTYIQKYTGYISPGIFAVFILGMFWKRTTGSAAIIGLLTGLGLCIFFNEFAPSLIGHETLLYTAYPTQVTKGGVPTTVWQIPFLIVMGISFVITILLMVAISLAGPKVNPKAFALDKTMFKLQPIHIVMAVTVVVILAALYIKFW